MLLYFERGGCCYREENLCQVRWNAVKCSFGNTVNCMSNSDWLTAPMYALYLVAGIAVVATWVKLC